MRRDEDQQTPSFLMAAPSSSAPAPLWSVPHAGRDYQEVEAKALQGVRVLRALEDRHADRLLDIALSRGQPAIIARVARAVIDLNRDPLDFDPAQLERSEPARARTGTWRTVRLADRRVTGNGLRPSQRARAGLGLVPTHLAMHGALWANGPTLDDIADRVARHHRPYHDAIARLLAREVATHCEAILLDLHSMPTLPPGATGRHGRTVDVVLGDRHGTSAAPWVMAAVADHLQAEGLSVVANRPYAGGEITSRHGQPGRGIHAIQIEIDRRLYLDGDEVAAEPTRRLGCSLAALHGRLGQLIADRAARMAAE